MYDIYDQQPSSRYLFPAVKRLKTRMFFPPETTFKHCDDDHDSGYGSIDVDGHTQSLHPSLQDVKAKRECVVDVEDAFTNLRLDSITPACIDDSGVYNSWQSPSCSDREVVNGGDNLDSVYINTSSRSVSICSCDNIFFPPETERYGQRFTHLKAETVVDFFQGDADGDNQLHLSIINKNTNLAMFIISHAPEHDWLSFCNHLRQTPLHLAVLTQQAEVVRRLICAGAFVTAQDQDGNTPLHLACREGDEETVQHLLTPVKYAETTENGYSIPFQRLPQDMNVRNSAGHTCLHIAALVGNLQIVKMLLDAGAPVNIGDSTSGRTVLHIAAEMNDANLVHLLLSRRDINMLSRNYDRLTPLHLAYGRGLMNIVNLMYKQADIQDSLDSHSCLELEISDEEDNSDDDCASDSESSWYNPKMSS